MGGLREDGLTVSVRDDIKEKGLSARKCTYNRATWRHTSTPHKGRTKMKWKKKWDVLETDVEWGC